jgi:deoxyribonucleoside regulator
MKSEVYAPSDWIVYKAAELFCLAGKSHQEIAAELHVSESTVSRLFKRAKDEHIVEFVIREPYMSCLALGTALQKRYALRDVVVLPSLDDAGHPNNGEMVKQKVAREGSRYLQRIINPKDILGIAWGGTMYYLINFLNPCRRSSNTFVTLHGSLSCCDYELDVQNLVHRMSMALGGSHASILPEGLQKSRQEVAALKEKEKNTFALFERVTISLSGIGSLYPEATSPLSRLRYLKPEEFELLRNQQVYCDLMLRFLNEKGEECDTEIKHRTLAIDLETYKRIPCKIIVVSGFYKAHALKAVLQGGMCDVLITDYELARTVLAIGK